MVLERVNGVLFYSARRLVRDPNANLATRDFNVLLSSIISFSSISGVSQDRRFYPPSQRMPLLEPVEGERYMVDSNPRLIHSI